MSKVYVTGHKSPDTDSIAAAISYSYLKRQLGMDAVAARAGEPNKETKFALDYFKVEAPELLTSVARKNPDDEKTKMQMYWNSSIITAWAILKRKAPFSSLSVP